MMDKKVKKSKLENNYRIIRVEKRLVKPGWFRKSYVKTDKIVMVKFHAKDDDDARAYLKDYRRAANREYDYYFERYSPIRVIGKDGKTREYEDHFAHWKAEENETFFLKRIWDSVTTELWYWFIDRPNQVRYWIRDIIYFIKTHHKHDESWDLDSHVLSDLKWNVAILIKNKHGLSFPFLDRAVRESHKDDESFDIKEWNKTHHEYSKEEEKLAEKYQNEEYMRFIETIKLYEYYRDAGSIDETNDEELEFDRKWKHTLPIIPGTYNTLDYKKLQALADKNWNKIWEWMRRYGETLWD